MQSIVSKQLVQRERFICLWHSEDSLESMRMMVYREEVRRRSRFCGAKILTSADNRKGWDYFNQ